MNRRQTTLSDLAKALGISTATVSRALKNYPDISTETKVKVLEMARSMHYRPNTLAAGLRMRESKIIGVIVPSIVDHFFSSVIKGIMEVAYQADYRVMLCQSDESYEKEVADTRALFASRVDGILVSVAHGTKEYEHFEEIRQAGVPLVFFDKVPADVIGVSKVVVNDYEGALRVVEHLIGQGCRRIAHFRGPMVASTSRERFRGYEAALQQHGIPVDPSLIYDCEDLTLEEGISLSQRLLREHSDCDGIFAVTDTVALGAATALKQAGKRIPTDLAVAGFSDWKISSIVEPPLTSVAQPSLEMGRKAAELILREINATKDELPFEAETIILDTELKIRTSSQRRPAS